MRWSIPVAAPVAALCLVAACGSSPPASPAPTPPAAASPSAPAPSPEAAAPTGDPAPEALSDFRCAAGDGDTWTAAGVLTNRGKGAAVYQVSVYVGPLDGESREVRTIRIDRLDPGGSDRFDLDDVPAGGDSCHVQVLRLEG